MRNIAAPSWPRNVWIAAWIVLGLLAGLEGALLTYGIMRGWVSGVLEAAASVPTAIGTLVLAYYTWKAVKTANATLAREAQSERIARAIDLRRRYVEVSIPMTQLLCAPIQAIASNVILYASNPEALSDLISVHSSTPDVNDDKHNQYRLLTSGFTAIGNFYVELATLLDQNLFDDFLVLDRFAAEFLNTYASMEIVARAIGGTTAKAMQTLANDTILDRFGRRCESFKAARSEPTNTKESL